jgi:hypothetical protein
MGKISLFKPKKFLFFMGRFYQAARDSQVGARLSRPLKGKSKKVKVKKKRGHGQWAIG